MSYDRTSYVLALFAAIAILSGSGVGVGPAQLRLFDPGVAGLLIAFLLSGKKIGFRREYLFFYIFFALLIVYSSIILPVQSNSQIASLLQIVELVEYLVVFSVFSSFLVDKERAEHELVLNTVLWLTVVGSIISIAVFFVFGVRPVTQWYVFGFSAFGGYYAVAKYAIQREWYYLAALLIILLRILVGQSRSIYIFFPMAAIVALLVTARSTGAVDIFSRENMLKVASAAGLPTLGVLLFSPQIQARALSIIQLSSGFLRRPTRWIAGINVFERHPFGVGLGNYANAVQDLTEGISYPDWFVDLYGTNRIAIQLTKFQSGNAGPHSDFFRLLVELGFVGAALLVVFWIFLFKQIFNYASDPISISLAATMVYLVFQQLVNSQLFTGSGGIILVMFLALFSTYGVDAGGNQGSMSQTHGS